MTSPTPSPISDQAAGEPIAIKLPERVIDQLFQAADVSTYHPDGDQREKLYAFAANVVAETLARLPSTAPTTGSAPESLVFDDWFDSVYMPTRLERDRVAERHAAIAGWIAAHEHWGNTASPVASVPFLGESDMSALMTFHSQMEDHEADGYTVHKETMKRLAELGVVNSLGFGRYETTAFGAWLVETAFEQDPTLPLRTVAEHNERSALLAASMGGDKHD